MLAQCKVKIQRKKYTKQRIVKNILSFYSLASLQELKDGREWYTEANEFAKQLANRFNITIQQVAGVIAATSPQTAWDVNKTFAVSFLLRPAKFSKKSACQLEKCKAILKTTDEGEIYNLQGEGAHKTKRFYLNILHPELNFVTVDRHAWAICVQDPANVFAPERCKVTKLQYEFLEQCYIEAANQVGLRPSELQAVTWLVYRRLRDLRDHEDVPF